MMPHPMINTERSRSPRRARWCLAGAAALTAIAGGTRPLHAAGAEEWEISARLGYASVRADGDRTAGTLTGIDVQYGFDAALAARLSLASSWHPVAATEAAPAGTLRASTAMVGMTYTVDVLRWVPVFHFGFGFVNTGGTAQARDLRLGGEAGIGVDYLLSRKWALGILARYQHFGDVGIFLACASLGFIFK